MHLQGKTVWLVGIKLNFCCFSIFSRRRRRARLLRTMFRPAFSSPTLPSCYLWATLPSSCLYASSCSFPFQCPPKWNQKEEKGVRKQLLRHAKICSSANSKWRFKQTWKYFKGMQNTNLIMASFWKSCQKISLKMLIIVSRNTWFAILSKMTTDQPFFWS